MGEISILSANEGDLKIVWDKNNEIEVEMAEKQFNDAMKKKFAAFSVKAKGKKDVKITEFDPDAEKIILVPPIVGG